MLQNAHPCQNAENYPHPILVAEQLVGSGRSRHCMLAGDGAARFAQQAGFERAADGALVSARASAALASYKAGQNVTNETGQDDGNRGTVGAVVLDSQGNLAAATSTGGLTGQAVGRVGDTPCIGAGLYADNNAGTKDAVRHAKNCHCLARRNDGCCAACQKTVIDFDSAT